MFKIISLFIVCSVAVMADHATAYISAYHEYDFASTVGGTVVVTKKNDTAHTVSYSLKMRAVSATNGSLYIAAAAKSCAEEANANMAPGTAENFEWKDGKTNGLFDVLTNFTLSEAQFPAVVVQDGAGKRVGCGVLRKDKASMSLVRMGDYPGYNGTAVRRGIVWISSNDTNTTLNYFLSGVSRNSTGGIHIHAGMSCTLGKVFGHYWNNETLPNRDPWETNWTSNNVSTATGMISVNTGHHEQETVGRTVVVHDADAGGKYTTVGCGVIASTASLSKYYNYNGSVPDGVVRLVSVDGTTNEVSFVISGLIPNTTGQVHIHNNTSCDGPAGPHYYYQMSNDPWNKTNCPLTSNAAGVAIGSFNLSYGYSFAQSLQHVVVVHDANGIMVACGVLSGVLSPSPAPTAAPAAPTAAPAVAPTAGATPSAAPVSPTAAASTASTTAVVGYFALLASILVVFAY